MGYSKARGGLFASPLDGFVVFGFFMRPWILSPWPAFCQVGLEAALDSILPL